MSHPQALSQCSEYLEAHGLRPIQWSNTAAAARYVAQEAPPGWPPYALKRPPGSMASPSWRRASRTRRRTPPGFILISREAILPQDAGKISLCFALPHVTGSLSGVLQRFAMAGLNLTKIESRPLPGRNFEYDFYLDFTGNLHQPATLELICALQEELPRFSFFGQLQRAVIYF